MPISINLHKDGYFHQKWTGVVTNDEMLFAFKSFYQSDRWIPGVSKLVDMLEADLTLISSEAIVELASFTRATMIKRGVTSTKCAVCARRDYSIDLVRVYEETNHDSPEVFFYTPILMEALIWLREDTVHLVKR